jgi:hypothetical protein
VREPHSSERGDVTVALSNINDTETVLANGQPVGTAGYGETRTIDLGMLAGADRITLEDRNTTGGYAWGFVVFPPRPVSLPAREFGGCQARRRTSGDTSPRPA